MPLKNTFVYSILLGHGLLRKPQGHSVRIYANAKASSKRLGATIPQTYYFNLFQYFHIHWSYILDLCFHCDCDDRISH